MAESSTAQPILRSMQPFALKRGDTTKVRFNGEKLAGTYRAMSYSHGWQDADWKIREDGLQATAQVTVAEDCDRGWHYLRLCSPTGISDLVPFYVSDDKPLAESRKPHAQDAPQEIPPTSLIAGTLQPRDIDAYAIQVEKGQRISAEVQGLRAGRAMFDPQLELIGPEGESLAACDDTPLTRQDPYLSVVAPVTGRYLLLVSESQHTGNPGFWYLLHVGSFPRPSIARQLGGPPKSQLQLTWLGADGPLFDQPVTLPESATDEFPVYPADAQGVAPTPVYLRVNNLPVVDEVEPNGYQSPQLVPVPVAIHGVLQQDKDDDLFRVTVKQGQVLDIHAFARNPHRSAMDAVLGIRRSDNTHLTSNDDANNSPDSYLRFSFPEDGDYFILIRDQMTRGQPDMAYRLEIRPPVPSVSLSSPEWQQNVSPTLPVPSNNRVAMLLNVNRQDIGGEVIIRAGDLPQHVSMAEAHLPADRYQIPVLFEADADSAPAGTLATITGELVDGTSHVLGRLTIRHRLVSGRNNVEMLATTLDRLAMVVTDPVPVTLRIVQPQVPLVRSGTMNLKIQASRSADFNGPVTLYMLCNPNGVSSQGGITIPEGQTEATLAMTANEAAQLGTWPVVVVGSANLNGRQFGISTQIAPLVIADSYFALAYTPANVAQGASQRYAVGLTVKQAFEGDGTAELLGLPPGVTAAPVVFTAANAAIEFELQAAENARLGRFEGISCRLTIHANNEPIVHILGGGSLRVDPPASPTGTLNQTSRARVRDRQVVALFNRNPKEIAGKEGNLPVKLAAISVGARFPAETPITPSSDPPPSDPPASDPPPSDPPPSDPPAPDPPAPDPPAPDPPAPDPRPSETPVLHVYPAALQFSSNQDRQRVVVSQIDEQHITIDVTDQAQFATQSGPPIVEVENGVARPVAVGESILAVSFAGQTVQVPARVTAVDPPGPVNFKLDVVPVFTKAGCNSGACHGASRGQDGFRLSLFGFDPDGDYFRVTREQSTRRINLGLPEKCLLIEKPTGQVSHTGGRRIDIGDANYQTLLRWLEEGAQPPPTDTPRVAGIEVSPRELVLRGPGSRHRLVATATLSDGRVRDVTPLALFYSTDPTVAEVQEGLITAGQRGESFVACRFGEYTVGCQVLVLPEHDTYQPPPRDGNYIDELVADKLEKLRYQPAGLCTDEEFLRRATLDIAGRLPTEAELDAFGADEAPDKRQRVAEQLLASGEFDDLWTAYWADILLVRPSLELEKKPAYLYFAWLKSQIKAGVPFNDLVKQLLTAKGSSFRQPQTNFYAAEQDKLKIAENVAQAFLGIRTQCAQCHNHPFDRWTMVDYYGFAAFFQPIARKKAEDYREWIVFRTQADATHPVTGQIVPPKYLGGEAPQDTTTDRLELVANWITDPSNPYFAKNVANRVWALFFGRGIVEPVDDMRISNPPGNPQLYDAMAQRLLDYNFDVKRLALDIVTSHAYQRSTQHPEDAPIEANFGRAGCRRIPAAVLLDCISQVTEARDLYDGVPTGGRAVQAPFIEADYFLTTFGQSGRTTVCACERKSDPTLSQALHLLNGQTTNSKIRAGGVVERMLAEGKSPQDIIRSLYRRCLSRGPTDVELAELLGLVERAASPREGLEDVFWAILNSREFLFNR